MARKSRRAARKIEKTWGHMKARIQCRRKCDAEATLPFMGGIQGARNRKCRKRCNALRVDDYRQIHKKLQKVEHIGTKVM